MGEWRYSSTILDFVTRWMWNVSYTPLPLKPLGWSVRYPLGRPAAHLDLVEKRRML
jgi:hypothetical protein